MIDVSCIILSNLNDLFVKERLIPSILDNSKLYNIEIIVVDNSPDHTFDYDDNDIKIIRSKPWHIPKGYNKGASEANGKYLAFFHDDCILYDDKWIEKLTKHLDNTIWAVSPEKQEGYSDGNYTMFLKEVPLMMEKKNFLDIGGYDETYYVGFEDVLLCQTIVDKGKQIKHVPIKHFHYKGMSTVLMGCDKQTREYYKKIFLNLTKYNSDYFNELHSTTDLAIHEIISSMNASDGLDTIY